jgi:hypothetical protein
MVADHFVYDESQELFGKIGIEFGVIGQLTQTRDLSGLAARIARWETRFGLVTADGLGDFEPFGKHENERSIDIVDAVAIMLQLRVGHPGLPQPHLP